MKKIGVLALIVLVGFGCKKLKKLANINLNFPYSNIVDVPGIPGGLPVAPPGGITADLPRYAVATNSQLYIKESGTSTDKIIHVKLKELKGEILQPSTQSFDYVDTLRIYLSAEGLPEQLVAYKYGIEKEQKVLNLQLTDLNLKNYFIKDTMYFRVSGHFIDVPDAATKMKVSSVFNMLANPLN